MKILLTLLLSVVSLTARAQSDAPSIPPPEGPDEIKQKDAIISQLTPVVMQTGDKAHGEQLFTQYCAICHKFQGTGKDFGPDLSLEGAFGPQKILRHIIDPNRDINPDFYTTRVDTQSGEEYDGVIIRDTKSGLTIHGMAGDTFVNASDVQSRKLTGRSMMPGGFESIGAEGIRDIISFLCAAEPNYRIIDLHEAFNADSRKGLWTDLSNDGESLHFKKFGLVNESGVPFYIAHPQQWATGKNTILLKGAGLAKSLPQQLEIPNLDIKATQLHFLSSAKSIAPSSNENAPALKENPPVALVTVHFADHHQVTCTIHYSEYFGITNNIGPIPPAKDASNLLKTGELRWITFPVENQSTIQSLTLSGFNFGVTPAFIAITAETVAK